MEFGILKLFMTQHVSHLGIPQLLKENLQVVLVSK